MKYSTTVSLAVLALPYLVSVSARPSSKRSYDTNFNHPGPSDFGESAEPAESSMDGAFDFGKKMDPRPAGEQMISDGSKFSSESMNRGSEGAHQYMNSNRPGPEHVSSQRKKHAPSGAEAKLPERRSASGTGKKAQKSSHNSTKKRRSPASFDYEDGRVASSIPDQKDVEAEVVGVYYTISSTSFPDYELKSSGLNRAAPSADDLGSMPMPFGDTEQYDVKYSVVNDASDQVNKVETDSASYDFTATKEQTSARHTGQKVTGLTKVLRKRDEVDEWYKACCADAVDRDQIEPPYLRRRPREQVLARRTGLEVATRGLMNVLHKRDDLKRDIEVLNFMLVFSHLSHAFYTQGLERYGVDAFGDMGYKPWVRKRFEQVVKSKRVHVEFLESALSGRGGKKCGYDFKDKSLKEWIDMAFIFENVGASAWNGVIGVLHDRSYQTVSASIMAVDARHAAWINSVVRKSNPWNTPFETPLNVNQVYTIISPYIIAGSCPTTNPPLRATTFSSLRLPPCLPGAVIPLDFTIRPNFNYKDKGKGKQPMYVAWVSGSGTVFVAVKEGSGNGETKKGNGNEGKKGLLEVEVPKGLVGVVYVFVTKDGGKVDDGSVVAGPAVVWFGYGSSAMA